MVGTTVKIEQFTFDYLEKVHKDNNLGISPFIYSILKDCSYFSENDALDKKQVTLYFTDEQLNILKTKQEELGYENNFSRFVRYALFEHFMKEHDVMVKMYKQINTNSFEQLLEKCKNKLISGKYTSYDTDLLRNNEKYEDKISEYSFNKFINDISFSFDFLEYDMLSFLEKYFENSCAYSKLVGLSTNQIANNMFLELENGETLEPFTEYENIVPNVDSFYYLYIYYAFVIDSNENLDLETIFNETDKHITSLLEKYTFEQVLKYSKERYNIEDVNTIFDEKCLERFKLNELINFDEVIESNETNELE